MNSSAELLVVGAGAQAKYALEICRLREEWDVVGLIDIEHNRESWGTERFGIRVLGGTGSLADCFDPGRCAIVCTGNNRQKERLTERVVASGYEMVTLVHPRAVIAGTATVGTGCIVNPGAVIQPYAQLGRGVMVHAGVIVEHDNEIADYVNLAPGAMLAGWVSVRTRAYVYTGASIIPGMEVGVDAQVGAGAVVTDDVPERTLVAGVPARKIRTIAFS